MKEQFKNTIEIQLSSDLVPILESGFLDRIVELRTKLKKDYEFEIPSIRVRDNLSLKPNTYVIVLDKYDITNKAVLDKNDNNKTLKKVFNKSAKLIKNYMNILNEEWNLSSQIGHEFNDSYKVLLYSYRPEIRFTNVDETLFVFKCPQFCPETLDDLKALKLSQNCSDEQLEILLKWFKSNATTRVLGRKLECSNFTDLVRTYECFTGEKRIMRKYKNKKTRP